jgi:hypothetical protein
MLPVLFQIVIALLVAGFVCWLVSVLPFIAAPIKTIIQGVILFITLLWLLYALFGLFGGGHVRGVFS